MKFTGFYEARGPDVDEMATTLREIEASELLVMIAERLESVTPGTLVRIDLIAWSE